MAFPTREAVYGALYTQLQTIVSINTFTRRATLPTDVTAQNTPLLSLLEGNTVTHYDANRLEKKEWEAWIVLYVKLTDRTQPGAATINPLLDAIHDALAPNDLQRNEFVLKDSQGRILASWIRVDGTTIIENGDTDPAGVGGVLIPLKMLIP